MQTSTIVVLACLIAVVVAQAHAQPVNVETVEQSLIAETPVQDRSPRNKRGLLLLKKKLLLGALGLGAAKVGAVGAGVVGALALKAKAKPKIFGHSFYHHGPSPSLDVEVHHGW